MSATIVETLDMKGFACPLPIAKTALGSAGCLRAICWRYSLRIGVRPGLRGMVHDDRQRARGAERGRRRFVVRKR